MKIAEVAYPLPLFRTFDYEVPVELAARMAAGMRVRAPFGPRPSLSGIVLSVREGESAHKLRPVSALLDASPILGAESLELARWLSARYCAPIGECLKGLLPSSLRNARRPLSWEPAGFRGPAGPAGPALFELTEGQAAAIEGLGAKLGARRFSAALLFGVPASGKTEVYVRLIRKAVEDGGQALFLVPEIALTKPFFDDFARSVGLPPAAVGLWHSQMSVSGRKAVWLGARSGSTRVVVGARSACLLPFKDLRLAVVDEEQDESYKQDDQAPCYHARDVVLERARRFGALAVLGSATPSMESFAAVARGELEMLRMAERVARSTPPPRISILDRGVSAFGRPAPEGAAPAKPSPAYGGCLGAELLAAVQDRLAKREQSILLVNRRGFSNFILCRKCGWVSRCPDCQVAFIHHQEDAGFGVRCHHCGRRGPVPAACGQCKGGPPLAFAGVGTQKVVSELKAALPGVRVLRMDSDTVSREKPADEGLYARFLRGEADVLVGTKLVAKGYHFPEVTLVGVVDADTMLHMPDFRAAERTVQLLIQAAGRAGRALKPGDVLLQTAQPTHYAMQAVARLDYEGFAARELELRRELDYPPTSVLVRAVFLSKSEEAAARAAGDGAEALRAGLSPREAVLGPAPGVHAKLQGRFRYHLLVKVRDRGRLDAVLAELLRLAPESGVKIKVNVDPYDFF